MANTVRLKRSAVQGKAPVVGDLSLGELAVNTYDGKLYMKKNDGSDAIVEIGAGASVTTSDAAPSSPSDGDLWYRSSDGRMYVYYDDGSSAQWVDANPNLPPDAGVFTRSGTTVSLVNAGDTVDLSGDLEISSTSHVAMPVGTTAQRPAAPTNGQQRYNSDLGAMEVYVQGQWQPIANTSIDYGLITSSSTTTFDYGALS